MRGHNAWFLRRHRTGRQQHGSDGGSGAKRLDKDQARCNATGSESVTMAPLWHDVEQSDLFTWFGAYETGRVSLSDGDIALRLKPGGYQEFIDLEIVVDGLQRLKRATLALDRAWIADEQAAPFAIDITKSFVLALATKDSAAGQLAEHLTQLLAMNPRVLRRASALEQPKTPLGPDLQAALDTYAGHRGEARLTGAHERIRLTNGPADGKPRLQVILTYEEESTMVLAPERVVDLFLQAEDFPAGMTLPQDDRTRGPDADDPAFARYQGVAAGLARWQGPSGSPLTRVIDIRWLFPSAALASGYHQETLRSNAEGLPDVVGAPTVGTAGHLYGGRLGDPMLRMISGKDEAFARYIALFTVGPVVVKLFVADLNDLGLPVPQVHALAMRAAVRIERLLPSAAAPFPARPAPWWRKLLGRG
jgi:hypothetical protein